MNHGVSTWPGQAAAVVRARGRDGALQALVEDDRAYFRAGAQIETVNGWRIVYIPELAHLAAGCVVEPPEHPGACPQAVVERLRRLGGGAARYYRPGAKSDLADAPAGYERTEELIYFTDLPMSASIETDARLSVRPAGPGDDAAKTALYAEDDARPDGKSARAQDYVALERIKIDAGYMDPFLVEVDGEPAGCFGLSRTGALYRLKNLFAAPRFRGLGCGAAMVAFAARHARSNGADGLGVLAIAGGAGERLYARSGMRVIGVQTEYYRQLDRPSPDLVPGASR